MQSYEKFPFYLYLCKLKLKKMHKLLRIQEEKRTIEQMIHLYCRHKEGNKELCDSCRQLLEYTQERLSKCPFQEKKETCRLCTVHCYRPHMRKQIQEVMKYAGPRMIIYHPIAAVRHLWREFRRFSIVKHKINV